MSTGWENYEAAPLEFFHGKVLDEFHALRLNKGDNPDKSITINGIEFSNLIAKVKNLTYEKYPKQVNSMSIPKSEL